VGRHRIFLERATDSSKSSQISSSSKSDLRAMHTISPRLRAVVDKLKQLVEDDIRSVLIQDRLAEFDLHEALMSFS
jgi:hypothetical protein